MPAKKAADEFMQNVQQHERAWGDKHYPARPDLQTILAAPVVAFWKSTNPREKRETITLHADVNAINSHLSFLILHSNTKQPDRRLARVFVNKRRIRPTGLAVRWEFTDTGETV